MREYLEWTLRLPVLPQTREPSAQLPSSTASQPTPSPLSWSSTPLTNCLQQRPVHDCRSWHHGWCCGRADRQNDREVGPRESEHWNWDGEEFTLADLELRAKLDTPADSTQKDLSRTGCSAPFTQLLVCSFLYHAFVLETLVTIGRIYLCDSTECVCSWLDRRQHHHPTRPRQTSHQCNPSTPMQGPTT